MKVAAYQPMLTSCSIAKMIARVRERILFCEEYEIQILCCPEAILGGLADYADCPLEIAINVERGQLQEILAPLASDRVTTIIGFTEIDRLKSLYNSAALFRHGAVIGIYRKLLPAINKSVYTAGSELPVFQVGDLTLGILICRDSTFKETAQTLATKGAKAIFIPTNTGLPPGKAKYSLVPETRSMDIRLAVDNGVHVVRSDIAGESGGLAAHATSKIVFMNGCVLESAHPNCADLIVADLPVN
jgi:predicted amidohydrolase